jgi:hypothetical protein
LTASTAVFVLYTTPLEFVATLHGKIPLACILCISIKYISIGYIAAEGAVVQI